MAPDRHIGERTQLKNEEDRGQRAAHCPAAGPPRVQVAVVVSQNSILGTTVAGRLVATVRQAAFQLSEGVIYSPLLGPIPAAGCALCAAALIITVTCQLLLFSNPQVARAEARRARERNTGDPTASRNDSLGAPVRRFSDSQ